MSISNTEIAEHSPSSTDTSALENDPRSLLRASKTPMITPLLFVIGQHKQSLVLNPVLASYAELKAGCVFASVTSTGRPALAQYPETPMRKGTAR